MTGQKLEGGQKVIRDGWQLGGKLEAKQVAMVVAMRGG